MSDSNQQPNFIDRVGKMAVFGFFGLLLLAVILFPIFFSMVNTGAISDDSVELISPETASEELQDLILDIQIENVKESYGTEDFECFTASDLKHFKSSNTLRIIRKGLKNDTHFKSIVKASRLMSDSKFIELVEYARNTRRPTWTELGKVSGKGQTDAGSAAEVLIADAIVDLLLEMRKK